MADFESASLAPDPETSGAAPHGAAAVARGICRMMRRNQSWLIGEVPLPNGRRADLMGLDASGRIVIVEIKVAQADLLGDRKWPEYLEFCDRFYWGVPVGFDHGPIAREAFMPERTGLIVADAYDAELLRPAALEPLAAARRAKAQRILATLALRRWSLAIDPDISGELAQM